MYDTIQILSSTNFQFSHDVVFFVPSSANQKWSDPETAEGRKRRDDRSNNCPKFTHRFPRASRKKIRRARKEPPGNHGKIEQAERSMWAKWSECETIRALNKRQECQLVYTITKFNLSFIVLLSIKLWQSAVVIILSWNGLVKDFILIFLQYLANLAYRIYCNWCNWTRALLSICCHSDCWSMHKMNNILIL